ncbi:MAG: hypothetical protein NVSMB65_07690 [Chloroflexota bacterium]
MLPRRLLAGLSAGVLAGVAAVLLMGAVLSYARGEPAVAAHDGATYRLQAPRATVTPRPTTTPVPPPVPTASLRLFVGPRGSAFAFLQGIGDAQERLLLSVGALSDPRLADALARAHARGVDVRVLYDPTGVNAGLLARLGAAGVLLRPASPAFTALSQATLVVDRRYLLLSTGMLTPFALDGTRSFVVRDRDPLAVAQVAAIFYDDWLWRPPSLFVSHLVVGPVQQGAAVAHVIDLAGSTLDVYTRRIDDPAVTSALLAAHNRGVRVRVLTSMDAGWGADIALVVDGLEARRLADPAVRGTVIVEDGQRAYLTSLALTPPDSSARSMGVLLRARGVVRVLRQTFAADWQVATIVHKPLPPRRPRPRVCRPTRKHPCPAPTPVPAPPAIPTPRHPSPSHHHAPAKTAPSHGRARTVTPPPYPGVRLRPTLSLIDPVTRGDVQELTVSAPAGSRVVIVVTYPGGSVHNAGTAGGRGITGPAGVFVDRWTIPRTLQPGHVGLSITVRHGAGWRVFNAGFSVR